MRPLAASWLGCLVVLGLLSDALAREWTDREGRTANGDFVRVFQGNVVLRRGKQILQVPFASFSPADQEFVKNELEKKNQGYLLEGVPTEPAMPETAENPEGNPATDGGAGENGNPGMAAPMFPELNGGVVPPPIGPGSPVPTPPVINSPLFPGVGNSNSESPGESSEPSPDPAESESDPSPVEHHSPPSYRPSNSANPWQNRSNSSSPGRTDFNRRTFTPPPSPPPMPPMYHPSQFSKVCMSCDKEVPRHLTAGDSCPHCHVTFDTDMTNGKTAFTPRRIGWMISVAVGVLLAIGRMLNR